MAVDYDKSPQFKRWLHDYRRAAAEVSPNSTQARFIQDTATTVSALITEIQRLSAAVSELNSRVTTLEP